MQHYTRIRDLREDEDLTQKQLCGKLGMHATTYINYERGTRTPPFDFAVGLAKFYGVSLDYIAGLTNDKRGLTKSSLSDMETELIKKFRSLSDIDKGKLLERLDALSERDGR